MSKYYRVKPSAAFGTFCLINVPMIIFTVFTTEVSLSSPNFLYSSTGADPGTGALSSYSSGAPNSLSTTFF